MWGSFAPIHMADARNFCILTALEKSSDSSIWRTVCISHTHRRMELPLNVASVGPRLRLRERTGEFTSGLAASHSMNLGSGTHRSSS
jgi:hypothetical protein